MEYEKTSRKIAKEAGVNMLGELYGGFARFTFIGILARLVGPEYLGIYSIANAITRIFGVIGTIGLDRGILRYVSYNIGKNNIKRANNWIFIAIKFSAIFGLIAVFFQYFSSELIVNNYFEGEIILLKTMSSFSIILFFSVTSGVAAHITQGFKILKYKVFTIQVIQPTILLACIIILHYQNFSNHHKIIYPLVIAEIIGFIFIFYFLSKIHSINFKKLINTKLDKEILYFSIPLMLVGVLGMIMHWVDVLMLGYFLPNKEVGLYQPAARTTGIIRIFLVSFSSIFSPIISELLAKKLFKEMKNIYKLTCRWILTLAIPFFILFIVCSNEIMLLFGSIYLKSAILLPILLLGMLFQAFGNPAGTTLVMDGKTKLVLLNTIFTSFLNIILNIILIPSFGLIGAAYATAISLSILCIIRIIQVWKYYNMLPFEKSIFKCILSGSFSALILISIINLYSDSYFLINLIVSVIIVFTAYVGALKFLGLENEDEEVLNLIKQKIQRG